MGPLSRFDAHHRWHCLFQRTDVARPPSQPPPVPPQLQWCPCHCTVGLLSPRAKASSGDSGAPIITHPRVLSSVVALRPRCSHGGPQGWQGHLLRAPRARGWPRPGRSPSGMRALRRGGAPLFTAAPGESDSCVMDLGADLSRVSPSCTPSISGWKGQSHPGRLRGPLEPLGPSSPAPPGPASSAHPKSPVPTGSPSGCPGRPRTAPADTPSPGHGRLAGPVCLGQPDCHRQAAWRTICLSPQGTSHGAHTASACRRCHLGWGEGSGTQLQGLPPGKEGRPGRTSALPSGGLGELAGGPGWWVGPGAWGRGPGQTRGTSMFCARTPWSVVQVAAPPSPRGPMDHSPSPHAPPPQPRGAGALVPWGSSKDGPRLLGLPAPHTFSISNIRNPFPPQPGTS